MDNMYKKNLTKRNEKVIKMTAIIMSTVLMGVGITGCGASGVATADTKAIDSDKLVLSEEAKSAPLNGTEEEETKAKLLTKAISTQIGGSDNSVDKEESVYVVAKSDGSAKEIIVSDHLKNKEEEEVIKDSSTLTDIKNVKGNEEYIKKGDEIEWNSNGKDIYYQGKTDKELPIDIKVTYYLEGKEVSADEIAGKSGNVKIRFDYVNKEKVTKNMDGEEVEVFVPFTVMSTMLLPVDGFENVSVENGRIMNEGNNNIVMGLAFPGLAESLALNSDKLRDKNVEIPEYVEVSAYATDFSLDMTLSVILSDALSDIHLTDSIDLTDVENNMDEMFDGADKLAEGTGKLSAGVQALYDKTGEFSEGAGTLYNGVKDYTDGANKLAEGINTAKSGTAAISDGVKRLSDGATALTDGAAKLSAGAQELNSKVQAINMPQATLSDEQKSQIKEAVAASADGALSEGAGALSMGITGAVLNQVASSINSENAVNSARLQIREQLDSMVEAGLISAEQADGMADGLARGILNSVASNVGAGNSSENGMVTSICKDALMTATQNGAVGGAEAVASTINGTMGQYDSMISQLKEGTAALANGAGELNSGANNLKNGVGELGLAVTKLDNGMGELNNGASTLVGNNSKLVDGSGKMSEAANKLGDGVYELLQGANDLNDGMVRFDKEGVSKLKEVFEEDGQGFINRLSATMEAAKDYNSFTDILPEQTGSVKFIIRTEGVK